MPTRLYYFGALEELLSWCRRRRYSLQACRRAWVGPAFYYARSRSHISVYMPRLDLRRDPPGRKRLGSGPWRHLHDRLRRLARRLMREAEAQARRRVAERAAGAGGKAGRATARATAVSQKAARRVADRAAARASLRGVDRETLRLAMEIWGWIPKRYRRGRDRVWTFVAALNLARAILRRAREKGVDPYQYDWEQLIDWSLGYQYARDYVRRVLGRTMDEIAREEMERWRAAMARYRGEEAARRADEELDRVAEWEMRHFDEII